MSDGMTMHRVARGLRLLAAAALTAGWASVGSAQSLPPEIQVGTKDMIDYEFDWGRDGVYDPTANHGAGNARLSYIDSAGNVWVGRVNPDTGAFEPPNGQAVKVDVNASPSQVIGNGPEWMISARGSELVYTRYTGNRRPSPWNADIGWAYQDSTGWVGGVMPGTSKGMVLPIGSMTRTDPAPMVSYQNFSQTSTDVYWQIVDGNARTSNVHTIALDSPAPGVTRRFVPGAPQMIMTYDAAPDSTGRRYRQVFLYDTKTSGATQLTFDPVNKYWAFMFQAPEYDNEYLFFVMVGNNEIDVYRNLPVSTTKKAWTVIDRITMPADMPYLSSPEPFVHNGKTWVFFTLTHTTDPRSSTATSQIAMVGIEPGDEVKVLTSDAINPWIRRDPEYYITSQGPFIYYNAYELNTFASIGVFRVDTGLGPPVAQ